MADIVTIYTNLAQDDEEDTFCKAVGQDDRSYYNTLFDEAEIVLGYVHKLYVHNKVFYENVFPVAGCPKELGWKELD